MVCPICSKELAVDASVITANDKVFVGGRAMRTDGGQRVCFCREHGVMKVANCLTDLYMKHEYPDMKLGKHGGYIPVTQVEPEGVPTQRCTCTSCVCGATVLYPTVRL